MSTAFKIERVQKTPTEAEFEIFKWKKSWWIFGEWCYVGGAFSEDGARAQVQLLATYPHITNRYLFDARGYEDTNW